ncbi:integrase catalytic domain-containing protein [Trichonephila clavipes]|nr:integrase catalytic domain-containing protein [Trichonephila clavipes]
MYQRIDEQNKLNDYDVVFRQWEDLQIMEKVSKTEIDNFGYYSLHRHVIKQASQTINIRPVFDASIRDKNQPSLNDCLNRGPNLIELITDIIDRFRLYPIGLSSDIEKAFLQLSIITELRDSLRFFLHTVKETKIYRHCRVVYGICSSPVQLSACIDHLLKNSPTCFDDVTQNLKHCVDNCVTRVSDIQEQEKFKVKAIEVMAKGCFNLRGWESNVPVGILSPTTWLPKILLQEACKLKLKLDDPFPENIQKTFWKCRDEIHLEKIDIPRYVETNGNSELHLFVDACKSFYKACVYVRTVTLLGVKIRLIRARSRGVPLKTLTILWLESMACCIEARLVHALFAALDLLDLKIVAWSDSMAALWWLKNYGSVGQFS